MENQRYAALLLLILMIASCRSTEARAMVTPKKINGGLLTPELGYTKSKDFVTESKRLAPSGPNKKVPIHPPPRLRPPRHRRRPPPPRHS
ncbi:hypothetical protein K2173_014822 [Erythroxylum novogranatense]|uniref:Uncharacterized protein n=1 Tax=Erythroxylum novogranatense TaxID=1862640 RepID=A0AAV8TFS3_9ROSI|nr:hypothetical protein K2173_014822 [Erythroxylum novogranatense]